MVRTRKVSANSETIHDEDPEETNFGSTFDM